MAEKHAHCGWCGQRFVELAWPRTCAGCGKTSWVNPTPVAVLIVPVGQGVLAIRRTLPGMGQGKLALPGGYVNLGESWQEAAARETFEEAQVKIDPARIRDLHTRSAPDGALLVFGVADEIARDALPPFAPNEEVSERVVIEADVELAYPLHTAALRAYRAR